MPASIRRRFAAPSFDDPAPVLNLTPLIDVLLVLLVMMILTIPITTDKIPIDLPAPGPRTAPPSEIHRIAIAPSGALQWDGMPIRLVDLPSRLTAITANPDASLQIAADPTARYDMFVRTLAVIKRAGVTRLGFVGNDRFADFS